MEIETMKFYDGNNIKRIKRLIKINFIESSRDAVEKAAESYISICKDLELQERIVDIEEKEREINLWVTYIEEEVARIIWSELLEEFLNKDEILRKCTAVLKKTLVREVKLKAIKYQVPIINITDDSFQLGYGKKSVFISKEYQSYENMIFTKGAMDRKWLWNTLNYSNIPVIPSQVIYSEKDLKENKRLDLNLEEVNCKEPYLMTICSVNKYINNKIIVRESELLKEGLYSILSNEGKAFIYKGEEEYRIINIKGKVKKIITLIDKVDKFIDYNNEVTENQIYCLAEKVYKTIPIKFMYVDIRIESGEIYVVDLGDIFSIEGTINEKDKESIAEILLKSLISEGIGSVPIFSVTGTNGKTSTARLLYYVLKGLGFCTGIANTGTILIDDDIVEEGDTTGYLSTRTVLTNPKIEAAVLEIARGGIIRNGLGYENANAAIITSLSEDHLGIDEIRTIEDLGKVKTVILEEVSEVGKWVLKGENQIITSVKNNLYKGDKPITESYFRSKTILFDLEKSQLIEEHIEKGGEGFYLEGEFITHYKNKRKTPVVNIKEIPFTYFGLSKGNILNVISVLAACTTLNTSMTKVVDIIKNTPCDIKHNPGRQNILNFKKCNVLLDYGHNPEAYEMVFSIANNFTPPKITSIITAPGDRAGEHIEKLGYLAGKNSDFIIIREQEDSRGSMEGRVAKLLKKGALAAGVEDKNLSFIKDGGEALIYAMERAVKGEFIVIFTEEFNNVISKLNSYLLSIGEEEVII